VGGGEADLGRHMAAGEGHQRQGGEVPGVQDDVAVPGVGVCGGGGSDLCEHMTRGEGHLWQVRGVPGGQNDAAVAGVVAQLVHHLSQLIHPLCKNLEDHLAV